MKRYTQKEFDQLSVDSYGNKQCPSGDYTLITKFPKHCSFDGLCYFGVESSFCEQCSFGKYCYFGTGCSFGEHCSFDGLCSFGKYCSFGKHCSFGTDCSFGEHCSFDGLCSFGKYCSFGKHCPFGTDCSFGRHCYFGMECSFGKHSSFGERCSFGEFCSFGDYCKCEFGIFQAMYTAGGFGSVGRTTYFFHMVDGSIRVRCGCFAGNIDAWENMVKKTHGFNRFAQAYAIIGSAVRTMCQK